MNRLLPAAALAVAALAGLAPLTAHPDHRGSDLLDDRGIAIPEGGAATERFETMVAAGMDDVRVTRGEQWNIRATGDARALAQLRYLVDDGSLIVGRVSGEPERFGKVQIDVTAPRLRAITAAGSGMLDVERLEGESASATLAGSGRARVRGLDSDALDLTIAGSGDLAIAGRTGEANVTIAGSGAMDGEGLTAGAANVTIAGSGEARFRSPGAVRASIFGSGTVEVSGTTDCRQSRAGAGRLRCTA